LQRLLKLIKRRKMRFGIVCHGFVIKVGEYSDEGVHAPSKTWQASWWKRTDLGASVMCACTLTIEIALENYA
jgi:hypothetical protein